METSRTSDTHRGRGSSWQGCRSSCSVSYCSFSILDVQSCPKETFWDGDCSRREEFLGIWGTSTPLCGSRTCHSTSLRGSSVRGRRVDGISKASQTSVIHG